MVLCHIRGIRGGAEKWDGDTTLVSAMGTASPWHPFLLC